MCGPCGILSLSSLYSTDSRRGDRGGGFDRGRGRGRGGPGGSRGDMNDFRGRRDGPDDFGGMLFVF